MKSVDDHVAEILETVVALPARRVPLADAHGCLLATDVRATGAVPRFDNSAMDGYAVRAADVAGARTDAPVRLTVVGDIPAGASELPTVTTGTAARIMTGAPFPPGADTVVQVEWTDGGSGGSGGDGGTGKVAVTRPAPRGLHIRRAGEDVAPGSLVLPAGTLLDSARIGLLATVNVARPPVHPRPRLTVVSTGDELVEVGGALGPGQIVDSNSLAVAAAAREAGAVDRRLRASGDNPDAFEGLLAEAVKDTDLLVTTGGVSVGAYDVVKQVLEGTGSVRFDRLAMQPGKPQGFGVLDGVPVFTLPGNPVSALVSFELFVRPAIRRMRGFADPCPELVQVRVGEELRSPAGKRSYLRVRLSVAAGGERVAYSAGGQGSHQLSALATADALLVVPEDTTQVPVGSQLRALLLGQPDVPRQTVAVAANAGDSAGDSGDAGRSENRR
jgi:molybdopterin molybdotransferase